MQLQPTTPILVNILGTDTGFYTWNFAAITHWL